MSKNFILFNFSKLYLIFKTNCLYLWWIRRDRQGPATQQLLTQEKVFTPNWLALTSRYRLCRQQLIGAQLCLVTYIGQLPLKGIEKVLFQSELSNATQWLMSCAPIFHLKRDLCKSLELTIKRTISMASFASLRNREDEVH